MKAPCCFLALALFCAAAAAEDRDVIRVAAAANLSGTLELLARGFERTRPGTKVEAAFASSGALAAQIRAAAPYELFLSADTATPSRLESEGLAEGKVRVYAYGVLCVASRLGVDETGSLRFLAEGKYRSIALAKPELAPYGLAAFQALTASGLLGVLEERLVYGDNIGQVNQFVASAACDAGFVNLSAILADPAYAAEGRPGIAWVRVPAVLYGPIAQAGIVLRGDGSVEARERERNAASLFEYILSSEGRRILQKAGYGGPP